MAGLRMRFEIFKRDKFTCQYCGRTPPAVLLELDHIVPRSQGGSDEEPNLITSCSDCNRGKANVPLGFVKTPIALEEQAGLLKERQAQMQEYAKLCQKIADEKQKAVEQIGAYLSHHCKIELTEAGERSFRQALDYHPLPKIIEAIDRALLHIEGKGHYGELGDAVVKYTFGILHNWRKGQYGESTG